VTTDWCDTIFLFTTYHNSFIISWFSFNSCPQLQCVW
jgi:hypothetical protein